MPDTPFQIDDSTIFDNLDARRVEFTGAVDGDAYPFAVQYDVLEALGGEAPDGDAQALFGRHRDAIRPAALAALARDSDQDRIVVSENDLA